MLKSVKLVVDLGFGSSGKGLLAGYLAMRDKPDTVITSWSSNAGHTYIDAAGRKFIHCMLANGVVSPNLKRIIMGPGSVINPDVLCAELESCKDILEQVNPQIVIHPNAAVILQKHIDAEQTGNMVSIGSTKKGCGEAIIDRIRRSPTDGNVASVALRDHPVLGGYVAASVQEYNAVLDQAEVVQVESCQGYGLSMYHGFYPYCTSRDISTAQIFADCALPIHWYNETEVIGTCRTFPIRVANRFDAEGNQVGYSGPGYPDQHEIEWSDIGLEAELTTVTKLPRRIFSFSKMQVIEAVRQCSANSIFLNFMNYARSFIELEEFLDFLSILRSESGVLDGALYLGFGPTVNDILEVDKDTPFLEITRRWVETCKFQPK